MLSIDWTIIFQAVLFLLLWGFLRQFLFAPNLALMQQRQQRSEGALQEARQVRVEAQAMDAQYKTRLAEARTGTMQQVDMVYREAEEQAKNLTDAARADAARTVASLREDLQKEIAAAKQDLEARVPEFARGISEKLLGRPLT